MALGAVHASQFIPRPVGVFLLQASSFEQGILGDFVFLLVDRLDADFKPCRRFESRIAYPGMSGASGVIRMRQNIAHPFTRHRKVQALSFSILEGRYAYKISFRVEESSAA